MRMAELELEGVDALPARGGAAPAAAVARVDRAGWDGVARRVRAAGGWLVALWGRRAAAGQGAAVSAAYALDDGLLWAELPLAAGEGYPDLGEAFPCAVRMQRAAFDLLGVRAEGACDTRPWLNHGHWPQDWHPLAQPVPAQASLLPPPADAGGERPYPFVQVAGDGVHEIAVGPIHAGVIEPGHFRFSVVGEKVLRLEERLGYTHKGTEFLLERTPPLLGHRLAGRVSGDSTVAFAWAYCMALETALGAPVPPRAQWLRALMLERERVANHLGDLGALGNDAGFAAGLAQFSLLKEQWLRLHSDVFGHRYLMDRVVPGGVAAELAPSGVAALAAQCGRVEHEVRLLQSIYDEHAGMQDRFAGTGTVARGLAEHFGLCGPAARASGLRRDLRVDQPCAPYDALRPRCAGHTAGDVAARVAVRFAETFESLRLIRAMLETLPAGPVTARPPARGAGPARGVGRVEGWRGEVFVALELDADGALARCHCHDPSWQNWPALEHAIIGNIVADFPLINKSFNLSYSGHDA
ncbi:NADH-quinone oxidoreductase subunit C [Pigmentiphaga soli]|uniref:NADH-quinone oxidoreductase subunit C n=1 Tax=Pigmentiphaga soli TaxID=1007095 RepID=A0ABP8GJZ9_9BURK